jgi:hypothetical protein
MIEIREIRLKKMDTVFRARTKCEEGEGVTLTTVVVLKCAHFIYFI